MGVTGRLPDIAAFVARPPAIRTALIGQMASRLLPRYSPPEERALKWEKKTEGVLRVMWRLPPAITRISARRRNRTSTRADPRSSGRLCHRHAERTGGRLGRRGRGTAGP